MAAMRLQEVEVRSSICCGAGAFPQCHHCHSGQKRDHLLHGGTLALLPGDWGSVFCTSKGTYGTRTDFEQQLLLPVADPSSDHVRLALYDVNKAKAASSRNCFARYLGKFINSLSSDGSKVANPETTLREGAIPEEGPGGIYEELGELQLPVRSLLHCKQVDVDEMLVPHAEVETRVVLSLRLHMLAAPVQKLREGVM